MRRLTILQVLSTIVLAMLSYGTASAFDASHFAANSKLATGKWVKITVPESGVYEITYDELLEMGFTNPNFVRLYGYGGSPINEVMNSTLRDDLTQTPVMRTGNKICFYANGPIRHFFTNYSTVPYFDRSFNAFSQEACYFLTEEVTIENKIPNKAKVTVGSYIDKPQSLTYFSHELELTSVSNSGKDMLGEDINGGSVLVDYDLPGIADSTIMVFMTIGASPDTAALAKAAIHSGGAVDYTNYTNSMARIDKPTGTEYYMTASPYGYVKLTHPAEHGQLEPIVDCKQDVKLARLDKFIITYTHDNVIGENCDNQTLMAYAKPRGNERFMLPNASTNVVVWLITDSYAPQMMQLDRYNDATGQGAQFFSTASNHAVYVAFDPTKTLKKIARYEPVENQNLHAMETPELLILTDKIFHEQAERIADLHRSIDGIDVAVVDQDKVFNEFSSGTRDAMAYRLLCKMLYDRNPSKFKNLLLMGSGTIDNRGIFGEHPGYLLTYQSNNSNYERVSYATDDFFGFLADNSGINLSSDLLSIGVGRITCLDEDEARSDVDKLVEYYADPDYGVWRNNALVFSDSPDQGKYMHHGEGYKNQIDNELSTGMHVTTVHNSMYPRSATQPNLTFDRKTSDMGKQLLSDKFKSGVYFATYVGHAGSIGFTKYSNMWVVSDVYNTRMAHLPIMSTACCDVARYDGDLRGVADHMFHMRHGGAIALMTASRMVYADENNTLNTRFINELFCNATKGHMPTLGEAYMNSKQYTEDNKMKFFLLGDPAIRVNYPVSRFNITKVNTTSMTSASAMAQISPLMKFDIEARVVDENGNLDSGFNGDATVTLYDKEDLFTTVDAKTGGVGVERKIYTNREQLAEVTGRVVNGIFHGQMIAPEHPQAANETVLLRVYAHQDNSSVMVNGLTKNIKMLPYNASTAITDNTAPVIDAMFINDESEFARGSVVGSEAMLYITASDDQAISMQSNSIDRDMSLLLDGKHSCSDLTSYVTTANGCKEVHVEYPLAGLTEGQHTLTYTVYDMLGNKTVRTITFVVGQASEVDLVADKLPAYLDGEVNFDLEGANPGGVARYTVRVTDATGKLMWMTTTSNFPVAWDMKDMQGRKVPAGLYRYFATSSDGAYSGTPIKKLIVLDPVKTRAN